MRRYTVIGRVHLLQSSASVASQFALSLPAAASGGGMVWGAVVGRCFGLVTMVRITHLKWADIPTPGAVARILRQYWRFPVIFAPSAAVNVLGWQLVMLVFPSRFGVAAAGMYALATRVVAIPGSLVGAAAGQVYLGELARSSSGKPAEALFLRWSRLLAVAGVLAGLTFWFVAPRLVGPIFGAQWEPAGAYVKYLGVMTAFGLLGSTLQGTWTVYQSALATVIWDMFRLCSLGFALWLAAARHASPEEAVAWVSIAGAVAYSAAWLSCWATVRFGERPQDQVSVIHDTVERP